MSSLTNERLRYWLNANQVSRERMCAGLLGIAGGYSNIKPRRPEGGPDGGRDLDAIYRRTTPVAVGIGFRNNVRDDQDDKRWISDKIIADASSARTRTRAHRFVFFTNVDLTPREIENSFAKVIHSGFKSCDIFHRERMRLLLDSPEGLGLRTVYLQIPLEAAEQAAFFEKLLNGGTASVGKAITERLDRMEFRDEMSLPLTNFFLEFHVTDERWWHRLMGGIFSLRISGGFSLQKSYRAVGITGLARRRKRASAGTTYDLPRHIELTCRVERYVNGATTEELLQVNLMEFDQGRVSIHLNTRDLFPDLSEGPATQWLDRTIWTISVPEKFADVMTEVRILTDGWFAATAERQVDPSPSPGAKENLSGLTPHRRELAAISTLYASMEIDFRRITPIRMWDGNA